MQFQCKTESTSLKNRNEGNSIEVAKQFSFSISSKDSSLSQQLSGKTQRTINRKLTKIFREHIFKGKTIFSNVLSVSKMREISSREAWVKKPGITLLYVCSNEFCYVILSSFQIEKWKKIDVNSIKIRVSIQLDANGSQSNPNLLMSWRSFITFYCYVAWWSNYLHIMI